MNAREEIIRRIRTATADGAAAPTIPRGYRQAGPADPTQSPEFSGLIDLFAERVADYRATVQRCAAADVSATIAAALAARGLHRVLVPGGFPAEWLAQQPADTTTLGDDPQLSVPELDQVDGVVTTCAAAIAITGTIVLDHGPGQGRRALTLVPDYHLAVVRVGQILRGVPEAVAILDPTRPLTWISGPSATSDIELSRVEGVHGPRTLEVIIVADH